jgi:hypothetical protein
MERGFGGAITIKNTGTTPINSWTLTWTWPGNQRVERELHAKWSECHVHEYELQRDDRSGSYLELRGIQRELQREQPRADGVFRQRNALPLE